MSCGWSRVQSQLMTYVTVLWLLSLVFESASARMNCHLKYTAMSPKLGL